MKTRTNFFTISPNYLYSNYLNFCFFLGFQLLFVLPALAQQNLPCYSIAKQVNHSDQLYEYNSVNNVWKNIGITGTFDIESIAVDYENSIIYAVNEGAFGTINPTTAKFIEIKELGNCNGAFGSVLIDDVCAITYDEKNKIVYAVHRNGLLNGILIKVNPQTGDIISEAFIDNNGTSFDYAIVEGILFGSPQNSLITDIADIAFESEKQILYSMYQDGNVRIIAKTSTENGTVESETNLIYKEIGGIGFDGAGNLKATTLSNESLNDFSSLFTIDIAKSSTDLDGVISEDFNIDFVCIDCAKKNQQISNCDVEINLTEYSPPIPSIGASHGINSNANVTTETEYRAVDFINLSAYFEVSADTKFSALIDKPCK